MARRPAPVAGAKGALNDEDELEVSPEGYLTLVAKPKGEQQQQQQQQQQAATPVAPEVVVKKAEEPPQVK